MVRRLTDSEKKYLEGLYKKRVGPTATANSLRISVRHVKRLWSRIRKTGTIHAARPVGRPTKEITTKMTDKVLAVHDNKQTGDYTQPESYEQTVSIKATKQYMRYWELQEG